MESPYPITYGITLPHNVCALDIKSNNPITAVLHEIWNQTTPLGFCSIGNGIS